MIINWKLVSHLICKLFHLEGQLIVQTWLFFLFPLLTIFNLMLSLMKIKRKFLFAILLVNLFIYPIRKACLLTYYSLFGKPFEWTYPIAPEKEMLRWKRDKIFKVITLRQHPDVINTNKLLSLSQKKVNAPFSGHQPDLK